MQYIDDIPITDFYDDDLFEDDDDMGMRYDSVGRKGVHISGIEGVITAIGDDTYYWMTHSSGTESFIYSGEVSVKDKATAEELEAYLGHKNGLPPSKSV